MIAALLRLLDAARGEGVRISPAEAIDALAAARAVGFADRALLRDALAMTVAKSVAEQDAFAACFDRYFSRAPVEAGSAAVEEEPGGAALSPLSRMILSGDGAGLTAAMEAAGQAIGADRITLFTQVNLFAFRMLDRMGRRALEEDVLHLGARPDAESQRIADVLEEGRERLRVQARGYMERQLALFGAGAARELREQALRRARLSALDRRDLARMKVLVEAIAKKLASRFARRRPRALRGALDARRTIRASMPTGGIPFRVAWKRRRIERPRLVVLCDVSGSVANVSRFLLMFLHALTEALSGIRSFVFCDSMTEITGIMRGRDPEAAIGTVLDRLAFGSSNYGAALEDFTTHHLGAIDRRTTVIVLGDARGNGADPRTECLRRIKDRAERIIWLNPETRAAWGTGDSDMPRYRPYCHEARVCNTVAGLERLAADLLRDAR